MLFTSIILSLLLSLLYLIFHSYRIEQLRKRGDNTILENVHLIFDRRTEAIKIALITSVIILIFTLLVFTLPSFLFGLPGPWDFNSILFLLIFALGVSLVIFCLSFLNHYYLNQFSIFSNYSGFGLYTDLLAAKTFLSIDAKGIGGAISVKWQDIISYRREGDRVMLEVARKPRWVYGLLKANHVMLRFGSIKDAELLDAKVGEHFKAES